MIGVQQPLPCQHVMLSLQRFLGWCEVASALPISHFQPAIVVAASHCSLYLSSQQPDSL